jgi:peptide-methionine (S)-S-oxide reductase
MTVSKENPVSQPLEPCREEVFDLLYHMFRFPKTGTIELEARNTMETATFGAGCFWGVEESFRQIPGVLDTAVGYLGGHMQSPTYQDVCTDETGHAEVVQVTYDPANVSYEQLLNAFWESHDPTTLNRQGPDIGTQYRSAIFFHSPEQERLARASKERMQASGKFRRPIVTEITPASTFYRAEDYHQKYLAKRGMSHCHI